MLALLKMALVFAGIMLLLGRRVHMGLTMALAAAGLALAYGLAPDAFARVVAESLTSRSTVDLALAILLIMVLEGILRESGLMRLLVDSLFGLARDVRLAMALLPALIGFLPSPAWARFLAPVVEEMTAGAGVSQVRKAFITYWYQHVAAYISPLFPALVLASHLLEIPLSEIILALVPVAAVAMVIGAPFAFVGFPGSKVGPGERQSKPALAADLLRAVGPIALVVALVLARVEVALALALVAGAVALLYRFPPARVWAISRRTVSWSQVATVVAIMVFKDVLMATGALAELPSALAAFQAPPMAVVLGVSLLAGLLTGSTNSSMAMALPILAGLPGGATPGLVALTFVWGFSGLLLAPAHPCTVLTLQHFRAAFAPLQRLVLVPQAGLMAVATLLYLWIAPRGG